jgi:hypothetical protein
MDVIQNSRRKEVVTMPFDEKEYQRLYQKQYQRKMHRILLTFNPSNEQDMAQWDYLQGKGSRNRIPFIKQAVQKAIDEEQK